MSSIRVVVNTAEESSGSILADVLDEKVLATRVLFEEGSDIMDEASDENKGTFARLLLDYKQN